jgi:hypothetical protein
MNKEQIASFCERYFAAAGCTILEKTPVHLTVKLSPEADRELTGRDYYWNFVERTGAEPETLSFRFILDPEGHEREKAKSSPDGQPGRAGASGLSVLHGLPPVAPQPGRTLEETLVFGSRRLDQLVASACRRGACLQLFEEPPSPSDVPGIASRPSPSAAAAGPSSPATRSGPPSAALSGAQTSLAAAGPPPAPSANPFSRRYATWLGVNYKISFVCDRKREELMSLGVHLSTGEIVGDFFPEVARRRLSPVMPPGTMIGETISLERAASLLEKSVLGHLARQNHDWAEDARRRLAEEEARVGAYYDERLADPGLSPEERDAVEAERRQRLEEIRWQHEPRIEVKPVNYGLFHLWTDTFQSGACR